MATACGFGIDKAAAEKGGVKGRGAAARHR